MYDKRLDAVLKAAELGSFNKAAREMGYSAPALLKQINGFESEIGITLFERTNKGVTPTPSGLSLLEDAREIVELSRRAVEKARKRQLQSQNLVRVGISLYHSGQPVLKLCQGLFSQGTDLSIQFVPTADTYESYRYVIEHFGVDIDVLPSTYLGAEVEHNCNSVTLDYPQLCLMVPLQDNLVATDCVDIPELSGKRLHVPARGNPYIDSARDEIAAQAPDVDFVEFPHYTMEVFDRCANEGGILLSNEIWRDIYPLMKTICVNWDKTIPYCLYYAKEPRVAAVRFVEAVKALVDEDAQIL